MRGALGPVERRRQKSVTPYIDERDAFDFTHTTPDDAASSVLRRPKSRNPLRPAKTDGRAYHADRSATES